MQRPSNSALEQSLEDRLETFFFDRPTRQLVGHGGNIIVNRSGLGQSLGNIRAKPALRVNISIPLKVLVDLVNRVVVNAKANRHFPYGRQPFGRLEMTRSN